VVTHIVRRLLAGLFIVWGVYTLTFFAVNLAPGDPFTAKENPKVQEEDLARLRKQWGYDRPVLERYFLHLRKMFWRDREVLEFEGGGLGFQIWNEDGRNVVGAHAQAVPQELRLIPTKRSAREEGAREVVLRRKPDGSWTEEPILSGRYQIGLRFLTIGDASAALDTQGLTIRVDSNRVRAAQSRTRAPQEVRLTRASGGTVVLPRTGDGRYGPVALAGDAYTFADEATSSPVGLPVPDEPLRVPGPTFNLGVSVLNRVDVVEFLKVPLVNTLILATGALLVQFLIGVLLGVWSAVRRGTLLDGGVTLTSLFFYSMPGFWLAVMLQLLFSVKLGWLPVAGMHGEGETGFLDLLEHLAMPVFVLGVGGAAAVARYQRSAMLEVLGQDYVRTARAKGMPERTVIWRHALRNALLPIITLLGLSLPFLVSGAVIIESIFSWPGIGREAITAIFGRDVFVVTGITLFATAMVVVGSLLADVLYAFVDPRVRLR
jgi:peptide/nickel transport system permease protein